MDGLGWVWGVSTGSCRFTWFGGIGGVMIDFVWILEVKTGLEEEKMGKEV